MNPIVVLLVIFNSAAYAEVYHCHGILADDVRVDIQGEYVLGRVSPAKARLTLHDITNRGARTASLMRDGTLEVLVGNGPTNSFGLKMASRAAHERISIRYVEGSPEISYTDAGETTPLTGAVCEFDAKR